MALTLAESNRIIGAAMAAARHLNINVCVAVCNRDGRLVAFQRMDGVLAEAGRAAIGKAIVSAGTGQPSGDVKESIEDLTTSLVVAEGAPTNRLRGGLPILRDGTVVGGCGVGGGPTRELDEQCSRAGIVKLHKCS